MDKHREILSAWQNLDIKNAAELEAALNGYIIQFAYHSGKIENPNITYNDTREIFDRDGVTNFTGDVRTIFEIRNAKDASNLLFEAFDRKDPLTPEFILQLHYELTKNTYDARRWQVGERPGTFKKHDYVTGRYEVGSAPEDVQTELEDLLEEIRQDVIRTNEHIFTAAAYFHAKFENIHPFSDGNGRTGRLTMNYFLLQHNHPPIVIHEEDKNLYYQSLEAFDTKGELEPLKLFLKAELVKTWDHPRFLRHTREKHL
ncbi:Fic family protein [Selenomonas noxia]|uniref:Fic family protein n=1 Tax=Selenomonas noxia TaxID=135083 RepID=UPI00288BB463|nr:Fic family protein [Selenomonas noxia]